jgi:hypothetical protein
MDLSPKKVRMAYHHSIIRAGFDNGYVNITTLMRRSAAFVRE